MENTRRHTLPAETARLLRSWRTRRGLSYRAAGARVGCSFAYLCELEQGRRAPSVTVAEAIAEAYGLDGREHRLLLAAAVPGVGRDWRRR